MQGAIFIPILKKDGEIVSNGRTHTTKFGANTSNFKQGMNEMVKELENYNKALVDNQYRQKDCNKTITEAQKEIKQIKKDIKENGKENEEQTKRLKELNETIEAEKVKLAQLKTEQASIRGTISSLSKEIAGNNKEWTTLKATMANLAADGVEALSKKLLEIGKNVISVGEEFTSSMSEVGAISGATAEELELLEQTAREYGSTTKFSASEAAQALKYMALAGWDVQTSIAALPGVLNLAAASGMDLATASDMVTDYLSAFGMEAQQAAYMADLMTYAQSNSNTSAQQLGAAWGNCAANMNAAGQDIETTTSFLEAMANQGLKSAEAGTAMAAIMRDITDKMKDGKIAIGDTNIAVADSEGNFRDLTDIMKDVEKAVDGLGTAESSAALSATFTARSLKGVNLILNEGVDTISGYEKALRNSAGSAADAAKEMNDNLSGDIKTMQSAFEELALKIYDDGETPIRSLVQTITKFGVPAIEGIVKSMDKIAPIIIAAATAMGSYKAALAIQPLVNSLVAAFTAKTAATTAETAATEGAAVAQEGLNVAMAANPIMAVISLVLALTAAIGSYIAMSNTATGTTNDLNESTTDYLQSLKSAENSAKDRSEQTESEIQTLGTLKDRYDELRSKVSLTTAEKKELDSIAEDLAGTLGTSTSALKEKDGTYKDLTGDIDEYIKKLREEIKFEANKEGLTAAYKSYDQSAEALKNAQEELDEYIESNKEWEKQREKFEEFKAYDESAFGVKNLPEDYYAFIEYDNKLKQLQDTVGEYRFQVDQSAESIAKYENAMNPAVDVLGRWDELMQGAINGTEAFVEKTEDAEDATTSTGAAVDGLSGKIEEYAEGLLSGKSGHSADGLYNLFTETADAATEASTKLELAEDALTDANKALEENKTALKNARADVETYRKEVERLEKLKGTPDFDETAFETAKKNYVEAINNTAKLETEQTKLRQTVKTAKAAYTEAAEAAKTLDEKLADLSKTSQTVRSEMDSLASSYNQLENGQSLSLSALLSLCDKYPEYTGMLLEAAGNADKQKEAIKTLFEAKKQEYLLTLQKAKDEIQASNDATKTKIDNISKQIKAMAALASAGGVLGQAAAKTLGKLEGQVLGLTISLAEGITKAKDYQKAINKVGKITIDNYNPPNNNNNNNNSGGSSGNSGTSGNSKKATTWTTSGSGETATGATRVESQLNWLDRMSNLGKMTEKQQKAYLEKMLKNEKMTADERYQVRLKLKNLTDKLNDKDKQKADEKKKKEEQRNNDRYNKYLKTIDNKKALDQLSLKSEIASYDYMLKHFKLTEEQKTEILKRRYNAQEQLRNKNQELAKAAYEKLVNDEIDSLKKSNEAIQENADKRIKAIDDEINARKQQQDDDSRQKELDSINAQLRYAQLDSVSRMELERRKQDLLNEQAEIDWEREKEAEKARIQEEANAEVDKNTKAIENLSSVLEKFGNSLAKMYGNQTSTQIVNNNSKTANIKLVKNGMTDQQLVNKFLKVLYS